jgi:alkylation response protein AidB-like acyl-CoA dehydrogenase
MDFDLTADESVVASTFEHLLARESSIERVRAAEAVGFDSALWKVLADTGAIGLAVPESAGGAGGSFVDVVLVAEACGRHLACVPFVEAIVAARLLAEVGAHADLLARAIDGSTLLVLSPAPAVDGVAPLVPGGAVCDAVLVLDGDELTVVEGAPATAAGDIGFLAAADRLVAGDSVTRTVLASGPEAHRLAALATAWWRLASAAVSSGVAEAAVDLAAAYATTREQFGVPIGSFQALQQTLADTVMATDGGRLLVRETAWRCDQDDAGWTAAAATAYAFMTRAAVHAGEVCIHVHGGYGYTLEYDAQLYLRRAKALQLLGGDPELLWEEIGRTTMEVHA